ncbi:zinc-dependent alcohol dehydrogenase family protein [Acetobacter sp.]|uniref:zinc-dependent alcohol dehydrogenase family protein n=1 Tax=Acetobacter sp. TaxID=440 RepID=UPI0039ED46AA
MKIKAALLRNMNAKPPYAESRPLEIETVEIDPPGPGEVLVKIRAAGLCHSDLSVINGDRPRPMPMVLGHECSGIVEEVGDLVTSVVPGDHVVMVFMPSCGSCIPCAVGRPALCEPGAKANGAGTLLTGKRRLHCDGEIVNHHLGVSGFAEYAVVSERSIVKIDDTIPFDEAALFGCAVLTGVGAVVNTANLRAGQSAAIIGLGGVGLAAVLGAVASGARQIVAIDLSGEKLNLAQALGATHAINPAEDGAIEKIIELTNGGVDYCMEMAGAVKAMELAWKITRLGGTTVTAGLPPPGSALAVPLVQLVAEERTLKGSYIGTCVPRRDIPNYIGLYQEGRLPVNKLMTGKLTLDQINEGFDLLHEGKAVRQIIEFQP